MDKVQLYDNERLDIPDTLALQDLVYEYTERVLSGIVGVTDGALYIDVQAESEALLLGTSNPNLVSIVFTQGKAAFYQTYTPTGTTGKRGRVIRLDTTLDEQSTSFSANYAALVAAEPSGKPSFYIWAHRAYVDSPVEERKFWEENAEVKKSVAPKKVEIIDNFECSKTNPGGATADAENWFIFAYVSKHQWVLDTPRPFILSAFDPTPTLTELDDGTHHTGEQATYIGGDGATLAQLSSFVVNSEDGAGGLIGLLNNVRTQLQKLIDTNQNATWLDSLQDSAGTGIGLKQVLERVTAAEAKATAIETSIAAKNEILVNLESRIASLELAQVIAQGYIKWDGAQYVCDNGYGIESVATDASAAGRYVVTLKTGAKAKAVVATPVYSSTAGTSVSAWVSNISWSNLAGSVGTFTSFTVNHVEFSGSSPTVNYHNADSFIIVTGYAPAHDSSW